MAKTLRDPTPTSSVARLLDRDVAARAIEPRTGVPLPELPVAGHAMERNAPQRLGAPVIKREFILTESADETFTRVLMLFRRATRTRMTASHLFRAMMIGLSHCFTALEKESVRMREERLPPNGPAFEAQRIAYEGRIAEAFVSGIRSAAAFHSTAPEPAQTRDQPGR